MWEGCIGDSVGEQSNVTSIIERLLVCADPKCWICGAVVRVDKDNMLRVKRCVTCRVVV